MLNRATVVNLFKKLKVVGPEEFLSRQFGTAGNIEPHVFMEWVFEAEIKTATIGVEEIEQAINTVPSSMRKLKERTIQVETNELDDAKETHEVHTDPVTGKRYSINKNTGESTWVVE